MIPTLPLRSRSWVFCGGRLSRPTGQLATNVQGLSHDGAMAAVADRKETALKLARRKGLLRTGQAAAAGVVTQTRGRDDVVGVSISLLPAGRGSA